MKQESCSHLEKEIVTLLSSGKNIFDQYVKEAVIEYTACTTCPHKQMNRVVLFGRII